LGGAIQLLQLGHIMPPDKVITEARARIIWGDSAASVRDYLVSNGISSPEADARLMEFSLERNQELRKIGFRNVLIGGLLTGAAAFTFLIASDFTTATSGIVKLLALVLMAGCYGLWKLWTGISYLVRPQSEHKSIPDIDQSDVLE
jgi:hypothetical protein